MILTKIILKFENPPTLISDFSLQYIFNPFPNKPWFLRVCSTSLLKTLWEKEKLLVTSNFSFSHRVFYPFRYFFAIFIKFEIVVCTVLEFGTVYNLSFSKGLKQRFSTTYHDIKRSCYIYLMIRLLMGNHNQT